MPSHVLPNQRSHSKAPSSCFWTNAWASPESYLLISLCHFAIHLSLEIESEWVSERSIISRKKYLARRRGYNSFQIQKRVSPYPIFIENTFHQILIVYFFTHSKTLCTPFSSIHYLLVLHGFIDSIHVWQQFYPEFKFSVNWVSQIVFKLIIQILLKEQEDQSNSYQWPQNQVEAKPTRPSLTRRRKKRRVRFLSENLNSFFIISPLKLLHAYQTVLISLLVLCSS